MTETIAAQAAEQVTDAIMEQAQVFASAWALFGGPFDQGDGKEQAEREEARLRDVIRDALSKLRAEGVQINRDDADLIAAYAVGAKAPAMKEAGRRVQDTLESLPPLVGCSPGDFVSSAQVVTVAEATEYARAALASAPVAGEADAAIMRFNPFPGLGMNPAPNGMYVRYEDHAATLSSLAAPQARPSDDALWDQTLTERDEYHDMADKLANAIADHLLVEIGEHSSSNCPWIRALEAIENAAPSSLESVRDAAIEEASKVAESTFSPHTDPTREYEFGIARQASVSTARKAAERIRALAAPQASTVAVEAPSDMPTPIWWINHGLHGQITLRHDEADRARQAGATVYQYHAAPQASEAVRSYRDSDDFHSNASAAELGAWQRGWDDCRASDQTQADKDGGDCAKGADQPDIETLRRVGAAHDAVQVCPECDIAGCKHIRAALAAQHPRTDGGGRG